MYKILQSDQEGMMGVGTVIRIRIKISMRYNQFQTFLFGSPFIIFSNRYIYFFLSA